MNMDNAAQTDINERGTCRSTYKMSYIPACLSQQTRTPPPEVEDQPTEISEACTRENVCDLVRWQIIMHVQSTASPHKAEH